MKYQHDKQERDTDLFTILDRLFWGILLTGFIIFLLFPDEVLTIVVGG